MMTANEFLAMLKDEYPTATLAKNEGGIYIIVGDPIIKQFEVICWISQEKPNYYVNTALNRMKSLKSLRKFVDTPPDKRGI